MSPEQSHPFPGESPFPTRSTGAAAMPSKRGQGRILNAACPNSLIKLPGPGRTPLLIAASLASVLLGEAWGGLTPADRRARPFRLALPKTPLRAAREPRAAPRAGCGAAGYASARRPGMERALEARGNAVGIYCSCKKEKSENHRGEAKLGVFKINK